MIRRVLASAASGLDLAATRMATAAGRRARSANNPERLGHAERLEALARIREVYNRPEFFARPDEFFLPSDAIDPRWTRLRGYEGGGSMVDLTWKSRSRPFHPEVSARYLACTPNHTAAARLYLHGDRARHAVMLIHGYLGGAWALEERAFPVRWLYQRGLDVALVALPFHGVRADPQRPMPPIFPGSDPRITVEGFRQAITDLRDLRTLLAERGAPSVGVMGMSLGGYTTSLLATVEPQLAFAVPMIPLASIADFAREQGRLVGTPEEQLLQHAAIEATHRVVSPFGRPSAVPSERIMVLAGEADRITPIEHARRVATHLNARMETFPGGHLLQIGRSTAFRAVGRMLGALGLLEPR